MNRHRGLSDIYGNLPASKKKANTKRRMRKRQKRCSEQRRLQRKRKYNPSRY
jgi:hypothetical protein